MSEVYNYDAREAVEVYEETRTPIGFDVIAGLLHVHCGKQLRDLHILDAGCGTGQYAKSLAELGVGKISLLDASKEMLDIAKGKLRDYIETKVIDKVIKARLPDFPFSDATFDAVMFNQVLHHLDKTGNEKEVFILEQVLHDAKRILRPKGVLVVSTCLSSNLRENIWFIQLHPGIREKLANYYLSVDQYLSLFSKHGFQCVTALNMLNLPASMIFLEYWDSEGPLDGKWRSGTNLFETVSNKEIKEMEDIVKDLKRKGNLTKFINEHDHSKDKGVGTLFICVSA